MYACSRLGYGGWRNRLISVHADPTHIQAADVAMWRDPNIGRSYAGEGGIHGVLEVTWEGVEVRIRRSTSRE